MIVQMESKQIQQAPSSEIEHVQDNQENANGNEIQSNTEIKLYSLRWWIGIFYAIQIVLSTIYRFSYGVASNIYKAYFRISFFAIDWFVLIQIFGMFSAAGLLISLILSERMGFRKLSFVMIASTTIPYVFSITAFAYPQLFPLIYVGEFIAGFGLETIFATFAVFVTSWFPENQMGLAWSIKFVSIIIGLMLAFLIPSHLVRPPPLSLIQHWNDTDLAHNVSSFDGNSESWLHETRWKFLYLHCGLLIGCLVVCVFVILFVTDEPPTPPSTTQALIRARREQVETQKSWVSFSQCWTECKSILTNTTVIYATIILLALLSCNYMERVLMGEISREVFVFRKYRSQIDKMSGYVLIVYEISGLFGNIAAGKLLDAFNRHKVLLVTSVILSLASVIGLAFARYFFNVESLFVFNFVLGFAIRFSFIPLYDMILQDTYPKNPALVVLIYNCTTKSGLVIVGQVSRLLLNRISGTPVLWFLSALMVVGLIVCIFLHPKYKRQVASNLSSNNNENQPLLENKEEH